MNKTVSTLALAISLACLTGCGGGEASLTWTTWGEDFLEQKIPAAEVEDGWELQFQKFLIVLGTTQLSSKSGAKGPSDAAMRLFDLHAKGPHTWAKATVPAGTWDAVSYRVAPATDSTVKANASEADLAMMKKMGYSIYLEGTATKAGTTKTFAWGFKTDTTYSDCKPQSPALEAGGAGTFQMTIHADHFFYDHLESSDAKLRFDAMAAADKDGDGKLTLAELAAVKDADFAKLDNYDVGRFSQVKDLAAFVTHLSRTLGHIDGEGHCSVKF